MSSQTDVPPGLLGYLGSWVPTFSTAPIGTALLHYYFTLGKNPRVNNVTNVHPETIQYVELLAPSSEVNEHLEKHWVSPKLPTIAGDDRKFPLLGTDVLRLHMAQTLHLIPDLIDVERFKVALAVALSYYPTLAGRLRVNEDTNERWIDLSNSAVRVTVDRDAQAPHLGDWTTAGYNLGTYMDPINVPCLENNDEPLLSIKLSYFPKTNETAIGVMMSHQVADGYVVLGFTKIISDAYQGQEPTPSHIPIPKWVLPEPAPLPPVPLSELYALVSMIKNDPRYRPNIYPESEAYTRVAKSLESTVPVNLRITAQQMNKLKNNALKDLQDIGVDTNGLMLSRQDAVTALIVVHLNKFLDAPIDHIRQVWNFRAITPQKHYGGNGISLAMTPVLPTDQLQSLPHLALAARLALTEARSPKAFALQLPLMQMKLNQMARVGEFIGSVLPKGRFVMNSDVNTDWKVAHFGYPDRVRFYSVHKENRYARVLQSNPEIGPDGKVIDSRKGSIDLHLRVDAHIHEQFVKSITEALNAL